MILVGVVALALVQTAAIAQPDQVVEASGVVRTHLDVRISRAIDLHFYIRALASGEANPAPGDNLAPAIQAARVLDDALGTDMLRWGPVEGALVGCNSAGDIIEAFGKLPETFGPRFGTPGKTIKLREHAVTYARMLQSVEAHFAASIWPDHKSRLEALERRLQKGLGPNESKSFEFMVKHLGMVDPDITIPVYLIVDAPFPGAFTHRSWGGSAVCFVSSNGVEGSQLYETVLHEATHALDVGTFGKNVFAKLREKLGAAGLSRRDRGFRNVPHTLMFVHTAETVRRVIDPDHKHYGHVSGYYKKVPESTGAVLQNWIDYLDGKTTQDEALNRIVQDFLTKRARP